MTIQFTAIYSRYSSDDGPRISAPSNFLAEDFADAVAMAQQHLRGAREAAPDFKYSIISIEVERSHGKECSVGWLTIDEFSAKVEAEKGV